MEKSKNECLLSIVVPAYNMEDYLDDCIISLLNQDVPETDYELIFVDDGSKDSTLDILNNYSKSHHCIKVISQENKGHAEARNVGLRIAGGKYVWFVDADDFIDKNCLSFIINILESNSCDYLEIRRFPTPADAKYMDYCLDKEYDLKSVKSVENIGNCYSGNKIILNDLLADNNIVWNKDLSPCDDEEFLFFVDCYAKNKFTCGDVCYYHRGRPTSMSQKSTTKQKMKSIDSYFLFSEIYDRELKNDRHSARQKTRISDAKSLCIQSILQDAVLVDREEKGYSDKVLDKLKDKRLYPYRKVKWNLSWKGALKPTIAGYIAYLLPCELYFKIYRVFVNSWLGKKIVK